ncbi:MAG: RDD family protein [Saprospiraceae bacterium]|nr:RDD family protein [Saprospiraceae bacterium]
MGQEFHINTTQNVELGYEIASLGDRLMAFLIDYLIKAAYLLVGYLLLEGIHGPFGAFFANPLVYVVWLLPCLSYHFLFEVFNNGQSPGKRSLRLQVVHLDGTNVTLGSYLLRWLMRPVDIDLTTGLGAIISIGISDRGQRIGDRVAGTAVVKLRDEVNLDQLAYVAGEETHTPTYPQVTLLTSAQIEIIRETLNNRHVMDIGPHLELLTAKLAGIMEIDLPDDPEIFLRTVIKDYSHYHS